MNGLLLVATVASHYLVVVQIIWSNPVILMGMYSYVNKRNIRGTQHVVK
jgi:hypothetical protein